VFKTAVIVFSLVCSSQARTFVSEGFVREQKGKWSIEESVDPRQEVPIGNPCDPKKLKPFLNAYVKLNWEANDKGCYSVQKIDIEVYDPLKRSRLRKNLK
jgi:hypothetical protein